MGTESRKKTEKEVESFILYSIMRVAEKKAHLITSFNRKSTDI